MVWIEGIALEEILGYPLLKVPIVLIMGVQDLTVGI